MPVITLSGALGGGAPDIGQLVAARLKIDYVDRDILVEAAKSLSVSPEEVEAKEGGAARTGGRLGRLLQAFVERSGRGGGWDPLSGEAGLEHLLGRTYAEAAALPSAGHGLDDATYLKAIRDIVLDLATRRELVLVG